MSDHHHHHHDHSGPIAIGATAARVVIGLLTVIGALTLVAAVVLWPDRQNIEIPLPMQTAGGGAVETEAGTVIAADIGACGSPSIGKVFADKPEAPRNTNYECERVLIDIESGPHAGNRTLLELSPGPGQPSLVSGDEIRIVRQTDPYGTPMYSFDDYARGFPLALIALVFVIVVIVVARWRGVRALLGLGFAFAVLVLFLLPALLDGKPAIPVALVAGSLILYAVLYLAHGVNLRTSSALLGTLTSMVLAAVLSWLAIEMTRLTGLSEEQNTNVATYIQHVSITGLLLAGFIIGSLGVLNDVTITQASAAFELAELDKEASRREVFAAAMRVGRDHIASTVYTLVLAYAGGALPLLLLFSVAGRSIRDVFVGDAVAIEIARSSVGGIALALSVPLTTGIAVMLARPFGSSESKPEVAVAASGPRHGRGAAEESEGRPARRRPERGAEGRSAASGGPRRRSPGTAAAERNPAAGGTGGRAGDRSAGTHATGPGTGDWPIAERGMGGRSSQSGAAGGWQGRGTPARRGPSEHRQTGGGAGEGRPAQDRPVESWQADRRTAQAWPVANGPAGGWDAGDRSAAAWEADSASADPWQADDSAADGWRSEHGASERGRHRSGPYGQPWGGSDSGEEYP